MSQDSNMDKNLLPARLSAEASKLASKPGDLSNVGKFGFRGGKKKDGAWGSSYQPGNAGSSGNVASRPKERNFRQKRTGYGGNGTSRKDGSQVVDSTDPDLDLILPTTGRKQNLAHLLNMKFQLVPREAYTSPYWRATHPVGPGQKQKRGTRMNQVQRLHYSKDQYLQANCQFVVRAAEDYSVYMAEPDLLVQWECIEQIRLWVSDLPSCPICLHPPIAARMTRCGHVFCWPCILHFLALSDKPYRPCPICDVPVRTNELKSVITLPQRQFKTGDRIELHLMKRHRNSMHPEQVGPGSEPVQPRYFSTMSDLPELQLHSKLLLATPQEVAAYVLERERTELQNQWEEEKDCPEACFIQQALDMLAAREGTVLEASFASLAMEDDESEEVVGGSFEATELSKEVLTVEDPFADVEPDDPRQGSRSRFTSSSSSDLAGAAAVLEDTPVSVSSKVLPDQKSVFYFYQSNDGQLIYLNTLNVQMLVRQYGSLERCPAVIRGRILERETLSMTEELRNRLRYLSHLPLTANFQVVEIELGEELVDREVFEEFKDRIDERERRRRRKDRDERRRDRQIQRAEDVKWGRLPRLPLARLDSEVDFPEFSPEHPVSSVTSESGTGLSPPEATASDVWSGPQPQSFAQMLREGKGKPPVNSWSIGSQKVVVPKKAETPKGFDLFGDDEECAPAPEYKETFGSALAAAFDKAAKAKEQEATKTAESGTAPAKGKGKKKNKQTVLFATGGMNFK